MHFLKKIAVLLISAAAVFSALFCNVPIIHAEDASRTVRVGWFSNGDFMHKDAKGNYEGYDIEYYYTLAQYANWKLEFVDYDTLTDAQNGLENGEIDFLSGLSKNADREKRFLFSSVKMASTKIAVQTRSDDDRFAMDNLSSLETMRCGILKNSNVIGLYEKWCSSAGITPHIVEYDSIDERNQALENKEIDAVAAGSTIEGAQKIAEFPSLDLFYAINQQRTDLKTELDNAMAVLSLENPSFVNDLEQKYFPFSKNSTPSFSQTEKEFLAEHSVVKVGLLSDDAPFSSGSSKNMKGYFPEYFSHLEKLTGISFECDSYPDVDSLYDALDAEDIDIIANSEKDPYAASGRDIEQTNTFMSADIVQMINTGTEKISTAAVPRANERVVQQILEEDQMDISLHVYENNSQCFQALQNKEVDAIYFSQPASTYNLNHTRASDYLVTISDRQAWNIAMSVKQGTNGSRLRSILNKTLAVDGESLDNIITGDLVKESRSFGTFVNQLPVTTIIILSFICCGILLIVIIAMFIILQRRKAEKQLAVEQANVAAATSLNKARHAFFGAVSHDMRTPLNGILGFTDMALNSSDPQEMKSYLKKIHTSGETLNLLVNDTLLMSRLENNKYILSPSPAELSSVLQDVLLPVQQTARENNVQLIDEATAKCHGYFNFDQISLQKVFINLLTNAVKFSKPGGIVRFGCTRNNHQFTFTVADEGIGIDEQFQEHIFEPFSQEDYANSKVSGSGLGLSIVKSIVDAMHGTIQVESKKGEGTTFTISLTLQPCAAPPQKKCHLTTSITSLQDKHVLICEDNELNMEIEESILRHAGMIVETAVDGRQGVECFQQSKEGYFDFILMDLRMPVMDGLSAAKEIRSLPRKDADEVLIFAVSADAFQENVSAALSAGMDGHIAKPINAEALLTTLTKALKKKETGESQ